MHIFMLIRSSNWWQTFIRDNEPEKNYHRTKIAQEILSLDEMYVTVTITKERKKKKKQKKLSS